MSTLASRIQALRVEGHSLAIIAATLSREEGRYYTRNSVAGLVHRAGLPKLEKKPSGPRKPRRRKPSRLLMNGGTGFKSGADNVRMIRTRPVVLPDDRPEDIPSASILDLTSKVCRWVCGDPRKPQAEIYCGGRVVDGSPYCCAHTRRAWREGGR